MNGGDIILGVFDVMHGTCWILGSLVRSFDMGRENCLPDFKTKTGKQLIREVRAEREERREKLHPHRPIGFH